jgi:RNA polymerase sigma-70 factor (ECF subfamily)
MAQSPHNDQRVIELIQAGDPRAYAVLVDRYKDRALSFASRLIGDRQEAEELVQDAFIRAYRALDRFRGESTFGTWFYRILHNLCLKRISRHKNKPHHISVDEEDGLDAVLEDKDEPSILERLEEKELQDLISGEIALLPEKFRSAVLLFYVEGMSYEEMAAVLEIPVGTVKTNLFRGRNRLRERVLRREGKEAKVA